MMQAPVKIGLPPDVVVRSFCALAQVSEEALMTAPLQTRAITEQRYRLMWLLHDLTVASNEMIARMFGRHTSTAWEAIAKVSDRIARDPEYRRQMRELREAIIQRGAHPPALSVDPRASAARVVAAVSVLRDEQLSDEDARMAALSILSSMMEANHG